MSSRAATILARRPTSGAIGPQLKIVVSQRAEAFGAELCVEVGGVLTGEHGVGVEKRDLMPVMFSEIDLEHQPKIRDDVLEDAVTLGGIGFSAHFGQPDGGWFPVNRLCGRFFSRQAGIFESFRHRYAGGGSSFGFPRARPAPGITTSPEWHLLPA
jgi:hypothetical protein